MKKVFVLIDILAIYFASSFAITVGSAYRPNIFVFLVSFLAIRTLLLWIFFGTFVHRQFPWLRSSVQFVILILALPIPLFLGSFVPFFLSLIESTNLFYYLVIPLIVAAISTAFQRFYQLESWQA